MNFQDMEENEPRTRSFRYEDYSNRRVFLRSYPLHWQGEADVAEKQEPVKITRASKGKMRAKKILVYVVHWGEGKIVILKRFKHKLGFYLVACLPLGFRSLASLTSG